jgi:hypothetical protein
MIPARRRLSSAILGAAFLTAAAVSGASAHQAGRGCSPASLRGAYAVRLSGIVQVPGLPERKLNAVATLTFNGAGSFDANFVGRINGEQLTPSSVNAGAYTVGADCTGTLELSQLFRGFTGVQAAFVMVGQGDELFFVVNAPPPQTNPAIIQVDGVAKRAGGGFR